MPIEITELVVRARVGTTNESSDGTNTSSTGRAASADPGTRRDVQMLEKAVEEALNLIKRKNER
jgi:hypothetical protein